MAREYPIGRLALAILWAAALACGCDQDETTSSGADPRVARGLEISPVPVDLQGRDADLIGLGSYIVNAQGACNDCHTCPQFAPGGDPFRGEPHEVNAANFLAGGRYFGSILAPNITPDAEGLPGGLTRYDFIQLMRTGRDPHRPGEILQVMPWFVYGQMKDHDLSAMYEYLSAIPTAQPGPCEQGG